MDRTATAAPAPRYSAPAISDFASASRSAALAKAEANEDRFGRMPQRTKDALVRKIEEIEKELEEAGASVPAAASAVAKDPA